jgi:hypothetical protein
LRLGVTYAPPSYSGGRDQKDSSLRPLELKVSEIPSQPIIWVWWHKPVAVQVIPGEKKLKQKKKKLKQKRAGTMAQEVEHLPKQV